MAKEYIGRIEALDACYNGWNMDAATIEAITVNIGRIPAADVVEVRHGRWIQKGRKIYCSKCNRGVYIGTDDEGVMQDEMRLRHFCSACGAKMDGGQDDV